MISGWPGNSIAIVPSALGIAKRVMVGRPMHSELLGETLLPKKIALPVFASDALSSVAYATEEILLVLSAGGLALLHFTWWIAAAVGLLMLVVVASYRQNVHAYPSGGGDYEVATTNLGPKVGLTVASALMVDYILTVAVSVSSGVANLASAFPALNSHVVLISVVVIAMITLLNLRGVRESGTAFAIPTYCFVAAVGVMIVTGLVRVVFGSGLHAESEHYQITNAGHYNGVLLVFLLLRAFASGCTALTGVEAISNGVPAFKPPKSKNAATTLALLGGIAVAMFAGVTALALAGHVHAADAGEPVRASGRAAAADGHRAGGPLGVRRLLAVLLRPAVRHGADPGAGREHRLQRLPGARLDPGQGRVPAAPAAHPRRPARVLQRHPAAGRASPPCWWWRSTPRRPG